jgi:predicted RND superfamily exporter protein
MSEIYPFKKSFAKSFQSVLKFHLTLNALIFAIPSLMIIIIFHGTFRVFLCVNNTKKVVIESKSRKGFVEMYKFSQENILVLPKYKCLILKR